MLSRQRKRRRETKEKVLKMMGGVCVSCGETELLFLDFHHLDSKTSNVSSLLSRGCKIDTILKEARKCQILCVYCHRLLNYKEPEFNFKPICIPPPEINMCAYCGEIRDEEYFIYKACGKSGRHWKCRICFNRHSTLRGRKRRMEIVNKAKEPGCIFCKEKRSVLLDMHHKDPSNKLFNIGSFVIKGRSVLKLQEELRKCIPVCCKCHRLLDNGLLYFSPHW